MTKSPHEVFDLAGRIFGMGVLIAARPDVEVHELPVKKVDDMAYRIYSLGCLDALNHANVGSPTDRILAGETDGTQYAAYCRPGQETTLVFALCPNEETARRFLVRAAAD